MDYSRQSPWLIGVPPLPADLRTSPDEPGQMAHANVVRLQQEVQRRKKIIRARRTAWERAHGPVFVQEPTRPDVLFSPETPHGPPS